MTAPHRSDAVRLHRWTDAAVVDELPHERVFLGDVGDDDSDCFDYCATFMDDGRVVANTRQQRFLLVTTDPLEVEAELWPDGLGIRAYGGRGQEGEPTVALGFARGIQSWSVSHGRLLSTHGIGHLRAWALPSSHQLGSP